MTACLGCDFRDLKFSIGLVHIIDSISPALCRSERRHPSSLDVMLDTDTTTSYVHCVTRMWTMHLMWPRTCTPRTWRMFSPQRPFQNRQPVFGFLFWRVRCRAIQCIWSICFYLIVLLHVCVCVCVCMSRTGSSRRAESVFDLFVLNEQRSCTHSDVRFDVATMSPVMSTTQSRNTSQAFLWDMGSAVSNICLASDGKVCSKIWDGFKLGVPLSETPYW